MSSLLIKEAQAFYRQFKTQIIGVVVLIALTIVLIVVVTIPSKPSSSSKSIDPRIRSLYGPSPDISQPLHMTRTFADSPSESVVANYTNRRNAHWLKLDARRARTHSNNLIQAFGSFSSLPPFLGKVLEVGCGPMSLTLDMLPLQPREIQSLTIVDPQVNEYASQAWVNFHEATLSQLQSSAKPSRFTFSKENLDFDAYQSSVKGKPQFDTIIWHGVLPHTRDSFTSLESLFSLLAPIGNLILIEQIGGEAANSELAAAVDVHQEQRKAQLQSFLGNLQTRYQNDESVLQRLKINSLEFDYQLKKQNSRAAATIDQKDKSQPGLVFFIGTKTGSAKDASVAQQVSASRLPFPRSLTPHFYYHPNKQQWRNMIRKGNLWKFLASIDSIFAHHPTATVHIFSNQLLALTTPDADDLDKTDKKKNPISIIQPFLERGLKLRVQPWNMKEFFLDTPLAEWAQLPPSLTRPRLNDAFRLAVLYKYGGVAMEPDMMLLHPLETLKNGNFMVKEAYRGTISRDIIAAQQHHPFLDYALVQLASFVKTYAQQHAAAAANNGTKTNQLIKLRNTPAFSHWVDEYAKIDPTLVPFKSSPVSESSVASVNEKDDTKYGVMTLYGPRQFFPFPWQSGGHPKFSQVEAFRQHELDETLQHSYTFRIWRNMVRPTVMPIINKKGESSSTAAEQSSGVEKNYLHPQSFLGRLIQANCVALCESFLRDNENVQLIATNSEAKRPEIATTNDVSKVPPAQASKSNASPASTSVATPTTPNK